MRTVELPDEVDPDKVTAQYRDGLLVITAPRAARARPRRVTVQGETGVDQSRVRPGPAASAEARPRKQVRKGNGRYVRVRLNGTNYLALAEVQAWGR